MPITKSAKKSLSVSINKREMNQKQKIELAKALNKISKENANDVISLIDKAAKNNIIHANKAGRMKSAIAKKYGTEKSVAAKPKPKAKSTSTKAKTSVKKAAPAKTKKK